jgi:hypothetical protein
VIGLFEKTWSRENLISCVDGKEEECGRLGREEVFQEEAARQHHLCLRLLMRSAGPKRCFDDALFRFSAGQSQLLEPAIGQIRLQANGSSSVALTYFEINPYAFVDNYFEQ